VTVLALGCDKGTGTYSTAGPPPRLVGHSFSTYKACPDSSGGECYLDVTLRPLIVLRFDRVMSPTAFGRNNVRISSGKIGDIGFKTVRVDPVERQVVIALDTPLLPSTAYTLVIQSVESAPNRLAAFDGAVFEGVKTIQLRTAATTDPTRDGTDVDPGPPVDPCKARDILEGGCAGVTCHGAPGQPPAMGLSLWSEEGIQKTACDRPAALVQLPESPGSPSFDRNGFPRGMAVIKRGSSAESFLIYKLLRRVPDGKNALPPLLDVGDAPNAVERTVSELGAVIPGEPMPNPAFAPPGPPALSWDDLHLLRRWIDEGAPQCAGFVPPPTDAGVDASDAGDSGSDAGDAADAFDSSADTAPEADVGADSGG